MAVVFNPAPGWPAAPAGWLPPIGWVPPRRWPSPPPGWVLYLELPDELPAQLPAWAEGVLPGQVGVARANARPDPAYVVPASSISSPYARAGSSFGARDGGRPLDGPATPTRQVRAALIALLAVVLAFSAYLTWVPHESGDPIAQDGCVAAVAAAADTDFEQVAVRGSGRGGEDGELRFFGTIAAATSAATTKDWTCTTLPGSAAGTRKVSLTRHDPRAPVWPSHQGRPAA